MMTDILDVKLTSSNMKPRSDKGYKPNYERLTLNDSLQYQLL